MKRFRQIAAFLTAALLLLSGISAAGYLLLPPRTEYGAMWDAFLQEPENSVDVLFLGSSVAYCDVMPTEFEAASGLSAYVLAGPEQTFSMTYYYLKEACRTQSPQTVCLELTGISFSRYQGYTKANAGYLPWSKNRLAAVFRAAEPELRTGLLLPLYFYHSRIYEAPLTDLKARLHPQRDPLRGYTRLTEAIPTPERTERELAFSEEDYAQALLWLRRISDLCAEEDIRLVLFLAPVRARLPDALTERLRQDLSSVPHSALWEDWSEPEGAVWYDAMHLNETGAAAFSRELALRLTN